MSGVRIEEAGRGSESLDQVEGLYLDLCRYMNSVGWQAPLIDGGESVWRRSTEKMLGRLGVVFVALRGDRVLGFSHGMLRKTPSHQGGQTVGVITNTYVHPDGRGDRLGGRLHEHVEQWFRDRGAEACELQVVSGNDKAIRLWHRLGYEDEFVQMRKDLSS